MNREIYLSYGKYLLQTIFSVCSKNLSWILVSKRFYVSFSFSLFFILIVRKKLLAFWEQYVSQPHLLQRNRGNVDRRVVTWQGNARARTADLQKARELNIYRVQPPTLHRDKLTPTSRDRVWRANVATSFALSFALLE